jgi:hypothetical protein
MSRLVVDTALVTGSESGVSGDLAVAAALDGVVCRWLGRRRVDLGASEHPRAAVAVWPSDLVLAVHQDACVVTVIIVCSQLRICGCGISSCRADTPWQIGGRARRLVASHHCEEERQRLDWD